MNAEPKLSWLDIGGIDDIPVRGARRLTVASEPVAVFRIGGDEVFAIDDKCPHAGGPLSEGIVHGDCVTCPLHNWVICLRDGKAQGPDEGQTKRYPIRVVEKRLLLGVAASPP